MNYEELKDKIKELEDFELTEEEYDLLLEEIYGDSVNVCGMNMYPPMVLKECDEVAYNMGLGEEEDYRKSEAKDELQDELNNARDFDEITPEQYEELEKRLEEAF